MTTDELPIFHAAYTNDLDTIRHELTGGVDPNTQHPRAGTTPLEMACKGDALDAIRLLIEFGADPSLATTRKSRVDGRIFKDMTPLMHVKSTAAAQILLDAGAAIDAADGKGCTPLVHAVNKYDVDMVRYFIKRGANVHIQVIYDKKHLSLPAYIDKKAAFWRTLPTSDAIQQCLQDLTVIRQIISTSAMSP